MLVKSGWSQKFPGGDKNIAKSLILLVQFVTKSQFRVSIHIYMYARLVVFDYLTHASKASSVKKKWDSPNGLSLSHMQLITRQGFQVHFLLLWLLPWQQVQIHLYLYALQQVIQRLLPVQVQHLKRYLHVAQ